MKIEYNADLDDFMAWHPYYASTNPRMRRRRLIRWVTLSGLFFILGTITYFKRNDLFGALWFDGFGLLFGIGFPWYYRWTMKNYYKRFAKETYADQLGENSTIELTDTQIITEDKSSISRLNIPEMDKLVETKEHFFIVFRHFQCLIVVKRFVEDQAGFKAKFSQHGVEYVEALDWKW